jgi:hypothetical protein
MVKAKKVEKNKNIMSAIATIIAWYHRPRKFATPEPPLPLHVSIVTKIEKMGNPLALPINKTILMVYTLLQHQVWVS